MAMLAGSGLFIIRHVLPRVTSRDRVLSIARMLMSWDVDDVIKELRMHSQPYDTEVEAQIRAAGSLYTSREFLTLLNFREYDDIDFDDSEGCTIIHDMNEPLSDQYFNSFDLVVENGTIEHIFDIRTAIGNIARCVKVGGIICHLSPLDAFNHGFYNFSINFFNDFYAANGFEDFEIFVCKSAKNWAKDQRLIVAKVPYTHEEFYIDPAPHNKFGIAFIARKAKHFNEVVTPIQAAYNRSLALSSRLNCW